MSDCIFCKMAAGEIPVKLLHDDPESIAIADIRAQAPVHLLVIPRKHIASLAEASAADTALLGHLLATAQQVATAAGLDGGYRVVINTGEHGGQTVPHLHLHILGGRHMGWPPG